MRHTCLGADGFLLRKDFVYDNRHKKVVQGSRTQFSEVVCLLLHCSILNQHGALVSLHQVFVGTFKITLPLPRQLDRRCLRNISESSHCFGLWSQHRNKGAWKCLYYYCMKMLITFWHSYLCERTSALQEIHSLLQLLWWHWWSTVILAPGFLWWCWCCWPFWN